MRAERRLRLVEFVLWVGVVAAIVVGVSTLLGLAIGGDLLTVKYVLFVTGFFLFGVGALGIQPKRPHQDEKRFSLKRSSEGRLEAYIQELPPLRDEGLRFDRRIGRAPKLLVAGLVVLGVSAFLEFGLGVAVGSP